MTTTGGNPNSQWVTVLWQNGGNLMSDDGATANFNNDAGTRAAQWVLDLFDKYQACSREFSGWDDYVAFPQGRISIMHAGPYWADGWRLRG